MSARAASCYRSFGSGVILFTLRFLARFFRRALALSFGLCFLKGNDGGAVGLLRLVCCLLRLGYIRWSLG
jgi:hypothetical protein